MRKAASLGGAVCVAAALLLFLAPAFRQALGVSLAGWESFFSVSLVEPQSSLRKLAQQAEIDHDAKALAFVAIRLRDAQESARLADEAVRLDPKLVWVYAPVASQHAQLPQVDGWVKRLEQWDPENALPYLLAADRIEILHVIRHDESWRNTEDAAWNEAMAAAFKAPKFDEYLRQEVELDGEVVRRHHFFQPLVVVAGIERAGWPSYSWWHCSLYSNSRLKLAHDLEAKGDLKRASEGYWTVARFGQLLEFQGHTGAFGPGIQAKAYQRLQSLSEKAGNFEGAALFSYLAQQSQQRARDVRVIQGGFILSELPRVHAWAVQISGLLMLAFGALILIAGLYEVAPRWLARGKRPGATSRATVARLIGAAGLLLSSFTLYLGYLPYATMFNDLLDGDISELNSLRLLGYLLGPQFTLLWGSNRLQIVHAFWFVVTVLCVLSLALLIIRGVVSRLRASAPA